MLQRWQQNKFPDSREREAVKGSAPWLIQVALLARQLKGAVIFDVFFQPTGRSEANFGFGQVVRVTHCECMCARALAQVKQKLAENACDI